MNNIFGTDGIRGAVFGGKMNPVDFMEISLAVSRFFSLYGENSKKKVVVIGRDTRNSCPIFACQLKSSLLSYGVDVLDAGVVPVAAVSYLVKVYSATGGIMVSASHNPYVDNGVKILNHLGEKVSLKDELRITGMINVKKENFASVENIGTLRHLFSGTLDYQYYLIKDIVPNLRLDGLKIVVDSANGAGFNVTRRMFEFFGASVVRIGNQPNGKNINKGFGATAPEMAAKTVVNSGANVGFCFDGDADRLVVIDEKGRVVNGDCLIASFAQFMKQKGSLANNLVVVTKMSNMALDVFLSSLGIDVLRVDVGDRNVSEKMKKVGAVLGGEESGHIIVRDFMSIGDGIANSIIVLGMLVSIGGFASEVFNVFKPFPVFKRSFLLDGLDALPFKDKLADVEMRFNDAYSKKGCYFVVRPSGTESLIRISVQCEDESLGNRLLCDIVDEVEKMVSSK